jgi:hypothetical protein
VRSIAARVVHRAGWGRPVEGLLEAGIAGVLGQHRFWWSIDWCGSVQIESQVQVQQLELAQQVPAVD